MSPTRRPTQQPTQQPTRIPTEKPSSQPSCIPTDQPSEQPSQQPSSQPTQFPYGEPTANPTISFCPTSYPTLCPKNALSRTTVSPTNSFMPTSEPTSLYDGYYPSNIIRRFKKISGSGSIQFLSVNTEVSSSMYHNGPAGIADFVKQIDFPEPMEYYFVMIDNLVAHQGALPTQASVNCSDPFKSSLIINNIRKNIDVNITCNGFVWLYVSQSSLYLPEMNVQSGNYTNFFYLAINVLTH